MKNKVCYLALVQVFALSGLVEAQKDSVYRDGSSGNKLVRGRVTKTTALEVTVETGSGQEKVPAREVKKVSFSGEPRNLGRARGHFESQRFEECLQTLQKIEDLPESKFIKQEIAFLEAYCTGQKALRGDPNLTTTAAEQTVAKFVQQNNDSYRLVLAIDLYARLLMANGKTLPAQKQYGKLTKSRWPKYIARGHFFEGETSVLENNLDAAEKSYRALASLQGNDQELQPFRQLAQCQMAKLAALRGDVDRAIRTIEDIILNESADQNSRLFAYAYNALGVCYLESNELKKACRAFLHTELLFSSEPDPHAEALYHLAKIWPQLKDVERANRARELLTSRYRNSIWSSKL